MQESKNLFRGICTEKGMHEAWIQGRVVNCNRHLEFYSVSRNGKLTSWKCDALTFGQFTGLRDDSVSFDSDGNPFPAGEQVFEDDICVYACGTKTRIGVVVWNPDYLWFELQFETGDSISFLDIAKNRKRYGINVQVKKIGDRFKNRDLCSWFNTSKNTSRFIYRGAGLAEYMKGLKKGGFVGLNNNNNSALLLAGNETYYVTAKSLGQCTGLLDDTPWEETSDEQRVGYCQAKDFHGLKIYENDILEILYPNNVANRMTVTYDTKVAAYVLVQEVLNFRYSFGTIQKQKERGEILSIKVVGNTSEGISPKPDKRIAIAFGA